VGTQIATETIRSGLAQITTAVLQQKLGEEAGLASYQDVFFMFAVLALVSLVPVLFMRGGKIMEASDDGAAATTDKRRQTKTSLHNPRELAQQPLGSLATTLIVRELRQEHGHATKVRNPGEHKASPNKTAEEQKPGGDKGSQKRSQEHQCARRQAHLPVQANGRPFPAYGLISRVFPGLNAALQIPDLGHASGQEFLSGLR
jgi:cell division protein ZapA (FtsZ GTPase activity inhibitor)